MDNKIQQISQPGYITGSIEGTDYVNVKNSRKNGNMQLSESMRLSKRNTMQAMLVCKECHAL